MFHHDGFQSTLHCDSLLSNVLASTCYKELLYSYMTIFGKFHVIEKISPISSGRIIVMRLYTPVHFYRAGKDMQ